MINQSEAYILRKQGKTSSFNSIFTGNKIYALI